MASTEQIRDALVSALVNELLEEIAKQDLGIETLAIRGRDSLDFHDLHVASVKRALAAAYEAGRNSR